MGQSRLLFLLRLCWSLVLMSPGLLATFSQHRIMLLLLLLPVVCQSMPGRERLMSTWACLWRVLSSQTTTDTDYNNYQTSLGIICGGFNNIRKKRIILLDVSPSQQSHER